MSNDTKENKVKQFSDLTECEKNDLKQQSWERAVREGRELLYDVVCAWRPLPGCDCGCNQGKEHE